MEFSTKFDIGDSVWFISNNKVSCMKVDMLSVEMSLNKEPKIEYTMGCENSCTRSEDKLFATKEELIKTL